MRLIETSRLLLLRKYNFSNGRNYQFPLSAAASVIHCRSLFLSFFLSDTRMTIRFFYVFISSVLLQSRTQFTFGIDFTRNKFSLDSSLIIALVYCFCNLIYCIVVCNYRHSFIILRRKIKFSLEYQETFSLNFSTAHRNSAKSAP